MAVFLTNICKFNGCGKIFPTLHQLILHIEETHIDFDQDAMEQEEQAIPMSLVLPYSSDAKRNKPKMLQKSTNIKAPQPLGTALEEIDIGLTQADDSKAFWTSDMNMRRRGRRSVGEPKVPSIRPYACALPGCNKTYKNRNGLKYHKEHGHKKNKLSETMLEAENSFDVTESSGDSPFNTSAFLDTSFDGASFTSDNNTTTKYFSDVE